MCKKARTSRYKCSQSRHRPRRSTNHRYNSKTEGDHTGAHAKPLMQVAKVNSSQQQEQKNAQVDHHIQLTWENIHNYLISKKAMQNENHDKNHKVRTLPDIIPGQKVLFLSPADNSNTQKAPKLHMLQQQEVILLITWQKLPPQLPIHMPIMYPQSRSISNSKTA